MRVFLSLCVLVTTAVAHPASCPPACPPHPCPPVCPPHPCPPVCPPHPCPPPHHPPSPHPCPPPQHPPCHHPCSTTTVCVTTETIYITDKSVYPTYVPQEWNIASFDSALATEAFLGMWYCTMGTPMSGSQVPSRLGIFCNVYPSSNPRVCFLDTTPDYPGDFSTSFYMIDMAYNLRTQQIMKTKALLKAAYSGSPLAMFEVCTQPYYPSPLKDLEEIIDEKLNRHTCDDIFQREYIMACIGVDQYWKKYMVFAICNKYDNIFGGKDKYVIIVLTRDGCPSPEIYDMVYKDIRACGLSPNYLISIDQSIDFSSIPSLSPSDYEVITDLSIMESLDTTPIPFEFVLKPDYVCPFDIDIYEHCGPIKILKNLPIETIQEMLCKKWYVQSCTPCLLDEIDTPNFGFLNNGFPCRSLQIMIDDSCPWTYNSPLMMLERAHCALTGQITQTRSLITSMFDSNSPYPGFIVYTEGCYHKCIPKHNPLIPEGCIIKPPSPLYIDHYPLYIAGYKPNEFCIFYIPNMYKNRFCETDDKGLFYVMTRSRIVSQAIIEEINQQILLCGYNPYHLINMDQYIDITDEFSFDSKYFQYEYSTSSSSITVEKSCSSTVTVCGC